MTPSASAVETPVVVPRQRDRGRVAASWVVRMVPWTLASTSLVLLLVTRPTWDVNLGFYAVDTMVALLYGGVAGVLLERRQHPVVWLLALMAIGCGLSAFGAQYTLLLEKHPGLPAAAFFFYAVGWAWMPGTFAAIMVVPWLVTANRLSPVEAAGVVSGAVVTAGITLAAATVTYPGPLQNPWSVPLLDDFRDFAYEWVWVTTVVLGLVAAGYLAYRHRFGPVDERRGLGWLAIGTAIMALSFVPLAPQIMDHLMWLPGLDGDSIDTSWLGIQFTPILHVAAQAFLPVALLVVILRQQLWGIDVTVNRATVWTLLTFGTIAVYVAVVAVVTRILPLGESGAGVVAAAVIALAFQPFRGWVQVRVDRLVYGASVDSRQLLSGVSDRLGTATDQAQALEGLAESIRSSMRLAFVSIRSDDADSRAVVATSGSERPADVEEPLVVGGTPIGALLVATEPGEALDQRARQTLQQLAPVIAVALQVSRVNAALARSRDRLVEVRQEERRALRRELHDGLGPALAGMGLALAAARAQLAEDLPAAAELVTQVEDELTRRTEDVRSLARTVLPPALDERGLVAALEELAERFTDDRMRVGVTTRGAETLDVAHQVGLYHVAAEALLNARKHTGAGQASVLLDVEDARRWTLSVADDGAGMVPGATRGIGLTSMRERAEELGATLQVDTGDAGTTITITTRGAAPGTGFGDRSELAATGPAAPAQP
jgi:signal transduction histidine kinase